MSIKLISGIPGSGKTYYVVYHLLYGDLLKKYFVFHNIPELKIDNPYLRYFATDDYEDKIDPEAIFCYKYQMALNEDINKKYGKNILWIIDECDKHGFGKVTPSIKEWLSMHRHLGQDIYLISQSKWNIAKDYMNLIEVEIQGKRGFLFDAFVYSWFSGTERVSTTRLPKKKQVYNSYRSFHIKELKKNKSKLIYFGFVFGLIGVSGMAYIITYGFPKSFKKNTKSINEVTDEIELQSHHNKKIINNNDNIYYVGFDGSHHLLHDSFGNIFKLNLYENNDDLYYLMNTRKGSTVIFYDNHHKPFEYSRHYLFYRASAGGGRAAKSKQDSVGEQELSREVLISIK